MANSKKQMAAARNLDEEMRQLLVEIRMLEGSARVLSSRLDIVTGALSETQTAKQTLEGTKESGKDVEMLIPIGSGSFVKSKLEDSQHVIIGVGAGVCIEKTVEDAIRDLNMRASDMDRARINVTQQLNQIINQTEDYRARLEDLAHKKGGGPVEIV
ncbi:MAG: prefoldin subunit alpha [Crenarchaeota archaeon 13_1_40CM_2_52_14]|nr:MAG: prefoldin subunit alpha [Crenarchaeota archaeon 13_1_40CM_3_52_17]OLD34506.1 MAG: prefoldin subunit alpha [Crenarchaeota archaeon 13_1_40CM_2_52_14]